MAVRTVAPPHPSSLPADVLLEQCELRTQRRSGPGGQHRNKTSSGVFLLHRPTEIVAEATERRSQAENRQIALDRLRLRLAIEIRTPSPLDGDVDLTEQALRERLQPGRLRIGMQNRDKPAALALVLNDLHAAGGQPSLVAPRWNASTSALVRFIKGHPPAFALLNAIRQHHGRGPLR
jgi:hypothetical protein